MSGRGVFWIGYGLVMIVIYYPAIKTIHDLYVNGPWCQFAGPCP